MGRPTKFSDSSQAEIIKRLRAGNTRPASAACAGVSYRSLMDWIAAGDAGDPAFSQFSQSVREAESLAQAESLAIIRRAARGLNVVKVEETVTAEGDTTKTTRTTVVDWRAAAWFLERRHAAGWQRRQTISTHDLSNDQLAGLLAEDAALTDDPDEFGEGGEEAGPADPGGET